MGLVAASCVPGFSRGLEGWRLFTGRCVAVMFHFSGQFRKMCPQGQLLSSRDY